MNRTEGLQIKRGDKIVIVGGGFAGLQLIKKLQKQDVDILLIDKQNHHQFQPLFYQVASARLEPASISFPFRKLFQRKRNVDFMLADVFRIFPESKTILTDNGEVSYDHLVIASGCKTNFFGNREIQKYSLSMKTTHEAIAIRNRILLSIEKMAFVSEEERKALSNIVIVGAGATGVELAGSFSELRSTVLPKDYPHLDFSHFNIMLLDGSPNTLNNMSEQARKKSREYLSERMGVEVRTNVIATTYDGNFMTLNTGEVIPTKTVIWAAGVTGNIMKGISEESIFRGRYIVDRFSRIQGYDAIYAIGDIAYMKTEKYPNGHPQVANVAINQGKKLAENMTASLRGKAPSAFEYQDKGSMATVGKHKAVVDLPFLKFHGPLAWFFWMFLHLMLILSVRNKLIVFINWAWSYITKDTSLRLIITNSREVEEEA